MNAGTVHLLQLPLTRTLGAALSGAAVGLGMWVAVAAFCGWLPQRSATPGGLRWLALRLPTPARRAVAGSGLVAAVLATLLLRMPVVGVLVLGAVWVGLDLVGGPSMTQVNELGAGIAAWSETVRQELEAGQPQRAALIAACDLPPPGLEAALLTLAQRLESLPMPSALWGFARDVRHPAAGRVVAALEVAYRYGAADLPRLMAGQVESTRHHVQMAREIHAARAKHRRSMVLLLALFFTIVLGLFVIWPDFLGAYRDRQGQIVLGAIGASVLIAVRSLVRLSQVSLPPDFFTGPAQDGGDDPMDSTGSAMSYRSGGGA